MAPPPEDPSIRVTLVCSPAPRTVWEADLQLPAGSTARVALQASTLERDHPQWVDLALQPGRWGRAIEWDAPLSDGDRLELCRPLRVDPKVARKERFKAQGAGTTGLFRERRAGAKAGY